jgi:hypothetical protein
LRFLVLRVFFVFRVFLVFAYLGFSRCVHVLDV